MVRHRETGSRRQASPSCCHILQKPRAEAETSLFLRSSWVLVVRPNAGERMQALEDGVAETPCRSMAAPFQKCPASPSIASKTHLHPLPLGGLSPLPHPPTPPLLLLMAPLSNFALWPHAGKHAFVAFHSLPLVVGNKERVVSPMFPSAREPRQLWKEMSRATSEYVSAAIWVLFPLLSLQPIRRGRGVRKPRILSQGSHTH